jgi:predicted nucleic acid-binding protein
VFLLDTNIVSEIVKRAPAAKVLARLNSEPPASLHISPVTVFELRFGAARSAKPASLWARIQRDILGRFQVLPFTEQDALAAADLMAPLIGGGQNLALQARKRAWPADFGENGLVHGNVGSSAAECGGAVIKRDTSKPSASARATSAA